MNLVKGKVCPVDHGELHLQNITEELTLSLETHMVTSVLSMKREHLLGPDPDGRDSGLMQRQPGAQ